MKQPLESLVIRDAAPGDARQIAEILVEDWQTAYRGIIDSAYLDAMDVEERYRREVQRYQQYVVASAGGEVLGFAWNELTGDGVADCEIVALYVRYARRHCGVGKALFQHALETFRAAGRKRMIVWCLRGNAEARRFYERMGGELYQTGTHPWGDRAYAMVSYLYHLDGGENGQLASICRT